MNKIQIIIPYTNNGIHGKDFEAFVKTMKMLKYPVDFVVVGDFPDEVANRLSFIDKWFKCREDDISEALVMVHKKLMKL